MCRLSGQRISRGRRGVSHLVLHDVHVGKSVVVAHPSVGPGGSPPPDAQTGRMGGARGRHDPACMSRPTSMISPRASRATAALRLPVHLCDALKLLLRAGVQKVQASNVNGARRSPSLGPIHRQPRRPIGGQKKAHKIHGHAGTRPSRKRLEPPAQRSGPQTLRRLATGVD